MKFTPIAVWRTRASPGAGRRVGDVLEVQHLRPPGSCTTIALAMSRFIRRSPAIQEREASAGQATRRLSLANPKHARQPRPSRWRRRRASALSALPARRATTARCRRRPASPGRRPAAPRPARAPPVDAALALVRTTTSAPLLSTAVDQPAHRLQRQRAAVAVDHVAAARRRPPRAARPAPPCRATASPATARMPRAARCRRSASCVATVCAPGSREWRASRQRVADARGSGPRSSGHKVSGHQRPDAAVGEQLGDDAVRGAAVDDVHRAARRSRSACSTAWALTCMPPLDRSRPARPPARRR